MERWGAVRVRVNSAQGPAAKEDPSLGTPVYVPPAQLSLPSRMLRLSLSPRPHGPTAPLSHYPMAHSTHTAHGPKIRCPLLPASLGYPTTELVLLFQSCPSWAFPALGAPKSPSGTPHTNSRALQPRTIQRGQRELGCGPAPAWTGQLPSAAWLPLTGPQPRSPGSRCRQLGARERTSRQHHQEPRWRGVGGPHGEHLGSLCRDMSRAEVGKARQGHGGFLWSLGA